MNGLTIDSYGTYARASAAADILELHALENRRVSREWAADHFRDIGAVKGILREQFEGGDEVLQGYFAPEGSLGEESEVGYEAVDKVWGVLEERSAVLGRRYPFALEDQSLAPKDGQAAAGRPYLALLWVTAIHAGLGGQFPLKVTDFFENYVASALTSRHFAACGMQTGRLGEPGFLGALEQAARYCGIRGVRHDAIRRRYAKDEKVDVIARVPWHDSRPIHWVYLVQATCGKSDSWSGKMAEVSTDLWVDLLGLRSRPRAVLAVPHHVPPDYLQHLTHTRRDALLLDRLALSALDLCEPLELNEFFQHVGEIPLQEAG